MQERGLRGALGGVTGGATAGNLVMKKSGKGMGWNGKMAKFVANALLRVIKVRAEERPGWFGAVTPCLVKSSAGGCCEGKSKSFSMSSRWLHVGYLIAETGNAGARENREQHNHTEVLDKPWESQPDILGRSFYFFFFFFSPCVCCSHDSKYPWERRGKSWRHRVTTQRVKPGIC